MDEVCGHFFFSRALVCNRCTSNVIKFRRFCYKGYMLLGLSIGIFKFPQNKYFFPLLFIFIILPSFRNHRKRRTANLRNFFKSYSFLQLPLSAICRLVFSAADCSYFALVIIFFFVENTIRREVLSQAFKNGTRPAALSRFFWNGLKI